MKPWSKKKKAVAAAAAVVVVAAVVVAGTGRAASGGYTEIRPETRDISTYLKFSGNIEAADTATVYAEAAGKIVSLPVEEGDTVKAGDVIAVLDSSDVENSIALKESTLRDTERNDAYNLEASQRTLDNYKEGIEQGYDSSLNTVQKALLSAQDQYQSAVEDYNKAREELEKGTTSSVVSARQAMDSQAASYESALQQKEDGMLTEEALETYRVSYDNACESYKNAVAAAQDDVDDKEEAIQTALESLEQAERDYESGIRTADLNEETYQDNVEKAQAQSAEETARLELEQLKESLEDYTVYAPMDGVITKLNLQEGDMAAAAAQLAEMADFSVMQVAVKIDEQDVSGVQEGQEVSVYIGALDKTYKGTVDKISRTAVNENNAVYVEAVVNFEADEQVRTGFGAEVELVKAHQEDALCLPSGAVSYDVDNTAYVYVKNEKGKPEKRSVKLGISDGSYVQVTEGISGTDTVLQMPQYGQNGMYYMSPMDGQEMGGPYGGGTADGE
ncbi:MAG: efflux RND transporter periplasmic adaptor subunit [Eubacteriales bacterium]|nr:efflux RND transporter periplasmic adaptor subunit [Eubacteriales bacterium]